jgi:hypothetical protein
VVIVVIALASWVYGRIEDSRLREPLEAVERAALDAGKPIAVLSPSTAEQWTDDEGPTEQRVQALVKAGNAYLEPLYYSYSSRHGGSGASAAAPGSRCYYFAAQRGSEFDAARVSALVQLCYLAAGERSGTGWVAIQ